MLGFVEVLRRFDKEGKRLFSEKDIQHVVPLLVLPLLKRVDITQMPISLRDCLLEFANKADISPNATVETASKKIETYYANNPINQDLWNEISGYLLHRQNDQMRASAEGLACAFSKQDVTKSVLERPNIATRAVFRKYATKNNRRSK